MPREAVSLKGAPYVFENCPKCFGPFPEFMRGQVQSPWRRLLGLAYCCVICHHCKQIIGYEKPPKERSNG